MDVDVTGLVTGLSKESLFAGGTAFGGVFSGIVNFFSGKEVRKIQNQTIEFERKRCVKLEEQAKELQDRIDSLHPKKTSK